MLLSQDLCAVQAQTTLVLMHGSVSCPVLCDCLDPNQRSPSHSTASVDTELSACHRALTRFRLSVAVPAPGMLWSLPHVAGVPACAADEHIIPLAKLSASTLTHVLGVQEVSGLRSEERVYGAHAAVAAANARKRAAADSNGSAAPVGGGGDAPKRWAPRVLQQFSRCGFACSDPVLLASAQRCARCAENHRPLVDICDLCSMSHSSDDRAVLYEWCPWVQALVHSNGILRVFAGVAAEAMMVVPMCH